MQTSRQIKDNPFGQYLENETVPSGNPFGIIYYNEIQFIIDKQTIKDLEFTSDSSKVELAVSDTFQKFTELLKLERTNRISEDEKVLVLQLTLGLTWLLGPSKFLQKKISLINDNYEQ